MRPSVFLVLPVALLFVACPNPTSVQPEIQAVETVSDPDGATFRLRLIGRGFGLDKVKFQISEGQGSAEGTTRLVVEIFDNQRVEIGSDWVGVQSVNQLEARFENFRPLQPGVYGVRLIYDGEVRATKEYAFEIGTGDAGVSDAAARRDASSDAGDRGTQLDATIVDADAEIVVDSGPVFMDSGPTDSGAFAGAFAFREPLTLTAAATLPAGTTFRVAVPHALMVSEGSALASGADLAVYRGEVLLRHQVDDAALLGSDLLELIVELDAPLPAGASSDFWLYHGDPSATPVGTDAIFLFVERFPGGGLSRGGWFDAWMGSCTDRIDTANSGAYCAQDDGADPTRKTLGSPVAPGIVTTPPAGTVYELSGWIGGHMVEAADVLYFAYSNDPSNFVGAKTIATQSYTIRPPTDPVLFLEQNGTVRSEVGWHLQSQVFTPVRVRFVPDVGPASIHFRYISPNGSSQGATIVAIDDVTVRLTAADEVAAQLGPREAR